MTEVQADLVPPEPVSYADRGTALEGWLVHPSGAWAGRPRGAVVIFPTIVNRNAHMERRARMLAASGFVTMIADFYGQPVPDFAAAGPLATALRADVDHYRARLSAGIAALRERAGGLTLSAVGYCMGGQAVLECARAGEDLALVASFHGLFTTARRASAGIAHKPRVLVCHGQNDALAPRADVLALWDELDGAGLDWHFHAYSGAVHGFTDPDSDARGVPGIAYDASADRQSWAALGAMLDEVYG